MDEVYNIFVESTDTTSGDILYKTLNEGMVTSVCMAIVQARFMF